MASVKGENRSLDDNERFDEEVLACDGICHEAFVGNTHDPYNLEMISVPKMPSQCCWIWVDRPPGGEIDMTIPFEGGKTFDERYLEDESKSGEICGEALVDNPDRPYNLFPMNPWMRLWISPWSDEMTSILKRLDHRTLVDESIGICDETLDDIERRYDEDERIAVLPVYNLFPLNPLMMLWMPPLFDEVWPVLVDRISVLPPIVSNILCA
jgi:hypothetical protein